MIGGALAILAVLLRAEPAAAQELADVAARIERLKASGVRGGPEIEALLARSQELAAELERLQLERRLEARERRQQPPAAVQGGDPQELRERADALRDEVDRLEGALADVDRRLAEHGRRRRAGRLAALEDEGALFSESSPGRVGAPRGAGTATAEPTGPSGPTNPTGPAGPTAPTGPAAPAGGGDPGAPPPGPLQPATPPPADFNAGDGAPGGPAPTAPAGTNVWSMGRDSRGSGARLAPERGDGEPELRSKRDAIVRAIAVARQDIQRAEAEARELDARP